MPVQNPERVATKQDLKDFYDIIFPYLGGNAEAGFTPIGTIIAVMGNSAPTNYLACNGQVVNIADYPELANYFLAQFGSRNKFGGDGTTTFGIPDLRGEFLRGTGTNGHTGQGGGSSVGTHQNSTQIPVYALDSSTLGVFDNGTYNYPRNPDAVIDRTNSRRNFSSSGTMSVSDIESTVTVRPTNTSVLFCIATKNIYLNPSLSYTEEEQVVGQWIDGKSIYQRVFNNVDLSVTPNWVTFDSSCSYDLLIDCKIIRGGVVIYDTLDNIPRFSIQSNVLSSFTSTELTNIKVIVQYTKTTD